jgi:methionyl-tRNA formyltransferase
MGTPEFAVASLEAMVNAGFSVNCVVTVPDKPAGRGLKMQASPVKLKAVEYGLPLLQPDKLDDPDFIEQLSGFAPDVIVVVAFRKLPEPILDIPSIAAFNLHASLLPQYRGAAPIQWAVINGETETGLTTFLLDNRIDTGKILCQQKVNIGPDMTAGELHDVLMERGASLVVETLRLLQSGNYQAIPQDQIVSQTQTELKKAPKIFREDCRIDWKMPVQNLKNRIRGLYPFPGAFTELQSPSGDRFSLKVLGADILVSTNISNPGHLETDGKSMLRICGTDGYVYLSEVQLAGKKIMTIDELLRGFHISNDWSVCVSEG